MVFVNLQVADAADNFLSFSAVVEVPAAADGVSRGAVTAHFGKPGAVAAGEAVTNGACSGVAWPSLEGVRFLGVHSQVRGVSEARKNLFTDSWARGLTAASAPPHDA